MRNQIEQFISSYVIEITEVFIYLAGEKTPEDKHTYFKLKNVLNFTKRNSFKLNDAINYELMTFEVGLTTFFSDLGNTSVELAFFVTR